MLQSKTTQINNENGVCFVTFPLLTATGLVNHAFTTKIGGVSKGIYATMNMGFSVGDDTNAVMENYKIICNAAGITYENLTLSHQTHTNNLRVITKEDIGKGIFKERDFSDIDGIITNLKNVPLVTQYADCTPLLFCDPKKQVIATSHAGWRGTVSEIGLKTVEKMREAFGCNPKDIIAAIGPCICKDCYEVDIPVYNTFLQNGNFIMNEIFTPTYKDHFLLDLKTANKQILLNAGIKEENIDISDLCTCHKHEYFHSHRYTNGKRGTLAAIIELKGEQV